MRIVELAVEILNGVGSVRNLLDIFCEEADVMESWNPDPGEEGD
jgi:hypothetical protein